MIRLLIVFLSNVAALKQHVKCLQKYVVARLTKNRCATLHFKKYFRRDGLIVTPGGVDKNAPFGVLFFAFSCIYEKKVLLLRPNYFGVLCAYVYADI